MLQFNTQFPDAEIVVTLSRQLSWSNFLALLPIKNKATQLFYAEKAGAEMWSIRELEKRLHTALIEAKEQIKKEN
jgi:predicted nuclease of restriction endonuclease-like (RecB) superfamily